MFHTAITNGAVEIVLPYPTLPSPLHYNVGFIGNENGPTLFENSPKTYLWPKGAPKSLPTPFSRCFEGMPAFGLPLVLLSLLVNLLAFRNSGFSLLRRVYTFGLDGPWRIHWTIYHEVEIHESGAFERGQR
jgi:hypothetical protein